MPWLWIHYGMYMTVINPLFNWTCRAIEPQFFTSYFLSWNLEQYHLLVPSYKGLSLIIVCRVSISSEVGSISCEVSEELVNVLFFNIGNKNSAEIVSELYQEFFLEFTIINGNGSYIQIWDNTMNWKWIIEEFINCPIIIFVLVFLWMSWQNKSFLCVIPIPNSTVVSSLKYPLWVTQYLYSTSSNCRILLWLFIA